MFDALKVATSTSTSAMVVITGRRGLSRAAKIMVCVNGWMGLDYMSMDNESMRSSKMHKKNEDSHMCKYMIMFMHVFLPYKSLFHFSLFTQVSVYISVIFHFRLTLVGILHHMCKLVLTNCVVSVIRCGKQSVSAILQIALGHERTHEKLTTSNLVRS